MARFARGRRVRMDDAMLSAQSAWRILQVEHDLIRDFVASIDDIVHSPQWWSSESQRDSLRRIVVGVQAFEEQAHRPKGVVLRAILHGRSESADRLFEQLDTDRETTDRLLERSLALLDAPDFGSAAAAECASLLERYGAMSLQHLHSEDTLLRSETHRLLSGDEWSQVVSSMSSVVETVTPRPPRRRS
jgi:hemerythrin-like domain-containing protein